MASDHGSQYAPSAPAGPIGAVAGNVKPREPSGPRPSQPALRLTQERYRSLVLATSSIVWTTDAHGRVAEDCPTWEAFTGQSFEQYRVMGWLEAIHPDDREHVRRAWAEALSGRRLYEVEYRLRRRDGVFRHVLVRAAPVLDEAGTVCEWVGIGADISERVSLEQALREELRINDILHTMWMMIAAELDLQKLVQQVTEAATSIARAGFGAFSIKSIGRRYDSSLLFTTAGAPRELIAKLTTAGAGTPLGPALEGRSAVRSRDLRAESNFDQDGDGELPLRSCLAVPVISRSSQVIGVLLVGHRDPGIFNARDERIVRGIAAQAAIAIENAWLVEDLRQIQQQLASSNDELERLVSERTAELQQVNAQLRASNRELEDFASVASHDLQEPLRKIQAFGDRLEAKVATSLGLEERDYLRRMRDAARRMQTLINDLLQFSRITAHPQPLTAVDLRQIVQEVLGDLETSIEAAGAGVELGELPTVDAEPTQMRQLFQNLIANALKFRRPDVPPVVSVHGERDDARRVWQIFVHDNGIGFDEKYLDRIFNVFQRLHGRGEYEGTGIGLAVCRKIVQWHGGWITARSTPGAGSTFIVTLPLRTMENEDAR